MPEGCWATCALFPKIGLDDVLVLQYVIRRKAVKISGGSSIVFKQFLYFRMLAHHYAEIVPLYQFYRIVQIER